MTPKRFTPSRTAGGSRSAKSNLLSAFHDAKILRLVFEDDWLLVVDKQAGYLTVPTAKGERDTVVAALCRYVSDDRPPWRRVSIVHRLDREASGLLVFAKQADTAELLIGQFRAHKPLREYVAIVAGRMEHATGTFASRLVTDRALNQRSTRAEGRGKDAVTHYRVLELLADSTLVAITLDTGRRNQIRVHFAEHGHPVLGDRRYEASRAGHPRWKATRLALHARLLELKHPVHGGALRFESRAPREFDRFIAGERTRAAQRARK